MPPYKTPEWCARARRNWLRGQSCALCGYRGPALSVVRIADSPPLRWTLKGPSHHQLNVVCIDAGACLKRRADLDIPGDPVRVHMCRRGLCRPPAKRISKSASPTPATKPPPRPLERHELPAEFRRYKAAVRKIEAGLARPDKRPVCPDHGPKRTMLYSQRRAIHVLRARRARSRAQDQGEECGVMARGGYLGPDGRRPVTRTREQWAELVALWYTVHGSTLRERLRLWLVVWWLARRGRLRERCTIRLDPEAFGVEAELCPPTGGTGMSDPWPTINPRPRGMKPPGDSGETVLR